MLSCWTLPQVFGMNLQDNRVCETTGRLSGDQSLCFLKNNNSAVVLCGRHTQRSKTHHQLVHHNHVHIPVVGLCSGTLMVNSLISHCIEHTLLLICQLICCDDFFVAKRALIKHVILVLQLVGLVSLTVYTGVAESRVVCLVNTSYILSWTAYAEFESGVKE